MTDSILDLDEYLENEKLLSTETKIQQEFDDEFDDELGEEPKEKKTKKPKGPKLLSPLKLETKLNIGTASDALSRHAKTKLEGYLKKSPQYIILDEQIRLLTEEYNVYKKAGRKDLCEKTQELLRQLSESRSKFIKIFKNKNWKNDKVENTAKIENSQLLKELKEKRKELEKEFRLTNPHSLVNEIRKMREYLNIDDAYNETLANEDDLEIDDNLDEILQNYNENELRQEYANLCGHIADIIDVLPIEVSKMKLSKLLTMLKDATPQEKITSLVNSLDAVKIQSSNEISKLKGNEDITSIIFEIFDFETTPEEKPKEMLAASNVDYVKAIAYNMCMKLSMIHQYEDAIAYGLLGLSVAIDKWYKIQKMKDSVVSFNGFAHIYIAGNIQKGLYELSSGGTISKSSMATIVHKRKAKMEAFLKNNPELKDVPEDMLESMLSDQLDNLPGSVTTESAYSDTVGGSEGADNADIWTNASVSNLNDEKYIDAKFEMENLLKSIKALFNLFETKTVKGTGEKVKTQFKVFDKFDYKLFKLVYGLEFKRELTSENKSTTNSLYTQDEIAKIFAAYYAANGDTTKTFSQGAISYRIETLNKKIKIALEENPSIKVGFEYLLNYFEANSETMNLISNNREELEIKLDRDELREVYANNSDEMNRKLLDGKKLGDIYQTSAFNPLDEEIADTFRNLI